MKPLLPTGGNDKSAARRLLHHPAIAWLILLVSFVLTAIAWHLSDHFVRQRAQDRFKFQTDDVIASISRRMIEYESALRGGAGLFEASESVDRSEWQAYATTMQIERYFPGIQGFGFTQAISPADRLQHERQIRAEGFPDYKIKPPGERELYTSIIYLEPFNERNQRTFGYDMFSEATRRAAMEQARDSGQPALSGRVTLVQETSQDVQHGILMYLPVYRHHLPHDSVEQRRAVLQGFVYAPFRMRDLMQGILGADQGEIDFELYDGATPSRSHVLHQTQPGELHGEGGRFNDEFHRLSQITVAGRTWSVYLYARPGFLSWTEESQPLVVAVSGVLVDLLLFFIIASIARQQQRAEALAEEMTVDLRRSNADLEQFAYAASHDLRQPLRMVSSYLQLLEADLAPVLNDETRRSLNFATEGAQRMDQMLTALLDYARINGRADRMVPVDSRQMVDEALRYLEPAIEEAQATVRIEGAWPRLLASHDEMVRLFQNLIDNALKYRVDGRRPEVVISAVPASGGYRFSVRDNGVGLIPGQEGRLFKVFERLQPRGKYPGTGIGLALCRKIVEGHGGRIWVQSAGENQGCCFMFTWPAETGHSTGKPARGTVYA